MVDVQTLATLLEEDEQWLTDHFEEVVEKYPGKVIAINQGQIVAIGDTWEEVCRPFQEQGLEVMPLIIDVPIPEQFNNLWL